MHTERAKILWWSSCGWKTCLVRVCVSRQEIRQIERHCSWCTLILNDSCILSCIVSWLVFSVLILKSLKSCWGFLLAKHTCSFLSNAISDNIHANSIQQTGWHDMLSILGFNKVVGKITDSDQLTHRVIPVTYSMGSMSILALSRWLKHLSLLLCRHAVSEWFPSTRCWVEVPLFLEALIF